MKIESNMHKNDQRHLAYIDILKEELIPAMGCTEPIAIAYAAARAKAVLGAIPDRVLIEVSDNIVKNVKSVIVPNTGNLKGIAAAAAAGIVAGNADKTLEVIAAIEEKTHQAIKEFMTTREIKISPAQSELTFDLKITVFSGKSTASVQISHFHTNIVLITKDDAVIYQNQGCSEVDNEQRCDRSMMNVKDIVEFAEVVDLETIAPLLQRQIDYNTAIATAGMKEQWGAQIGAVLLNTWGDDIKIRAKAFAAAASDARMSGCDMPVVIVSGSGNQGITASVPVIEYARAMNSDTDTLLRALVVSNLVTIHQKTGIGCLSAYCGAVSAGVGAGAGIAWLHGGRFNEIAHTIVNALAIVSGMICDGAKPSCAAKIASAVEAGLLGFYMYQQGQQFYDGDGIISKGVENTIANISRIGNYGMRETDKEVIRIMLKN